MENFGAGIQNYQSPSIFQYHRKINKQIINDKNNNIRKLKKKKDKATNLAKSASEGRASDAGADDDDVGAGTSSRPEIPAFIGGRRGIPLSRRLPLGTAGITAAENAEKEEHRKRRHECPEHVRIDGHHHFGKTTTR